MMGKRRGRSIQKKQSSASVSREVTPTKGGSREVTPTKGGSREGAPSKCVRKLATPTDRRRHTGNDAIADDGTQMEARRTRSVNESLTASVQASPMVQTDKDVFNKALKEFCLKSIEIGPKTLAKDFTATRLAMPKDVPKKAFVANGPKNRYKDVICLDETRVKLFWPPGSANDYVHANYVNVNGTMRYICTQGPTPDTTVDFWRIVCQEKCKGILMLCEVMEMGKKKCEQYWPLKVGEELEFGPVKVKTVRSVQQEEHLHITDLEVVSELGVDKIQHILWEKWPDRGVPKDYLACLRLIRKVTQMVPALVHCSAGIGRTGTIVGLEMLQGRLQKGEVCTMADIVAELRKYRHGSVQTDVQFLYMHRVIMELATNRKAITRTELQGFYEEYDKIVSRA